jgi:glycosyltransferase involved in cell wall biosynthesis
LIVRLSVNSGKLSLKQHCPRVGNTKERRLVILVDGNLSIFRLAHFNKLLHLVENQFIDIVVVYQSPKVLLKNKNNLEVFRLDSSNNSSSSIRKFFDYLKAQICYFKFLLRKMKKSDIVLFVGIYQPLSLAFVKLSKVKAVHFCGGFDIIRSLERNLLIENILLYLKWSFQVLMLHMSNHLIFESPSVARSYNLQRYSVKSSYNGHLFVESTLFTPIIPFTDRYFDVGFIGALSREKGVIEFIKSISLISQKKNLKVTIVGDGILRRKIENEISGFGLNKTIILQRSYEYSQMPIVLNNIKLLIVPSFSEGLPNIVIEAMACGTVVLANPVGGIPDVIKNNETGFLLTSNSPEEIAKKILTILKDGKLEKIRREAFQYIKENFWYSASEENWRLIFEQNILS